MGVTFPGGTIFRKEIDMLYEWSTEIWTHFPNGCAMPYESLEGESKF